MDILYYLNIFLMSSALLFYPLHIILYPHLIPFDFHNNPYSTENRSQGEQTNHNLMDLNSTCCVAGI